MIKLNQNKKIIKVHEKNHRHSYLFCFILQRKNHLQKVNSIIL